MSYQQYIPQFYTPAQPQMMQQRQPNITVGYIQGENAAKAYPIQANQIVYLFDMENPVMYIKQTDASGFPQPIRIFDYKERIQNGNQESSKEITKDYISREIKNDLRSARTEDERENYRKTIEQLQR